MDYFSENVEIRFPILNFLLIILGLFHRAISESGTALAAWARITPAMARRRFITFGILAGCMPVPTQVLVNCLKKIPAEEFVRITQKFYVILFILLVCYTYQAFEFEFIT